MLPCLLCHASFISASTSGPAHCVSLGHLKRGAISAAVESMTLATSVVMSLVQVQWRIGSSVTLIGFVTRHRKSGLVIHHERSDVLGGFLVPSLLLEFDADLRGMRTFAYKSL